MRNASGFKSFATEIATRPRESPPAAFRIAAAPNSLTGPGTALVTSVAAAAVSASSGSRLPAAGNQRLIPYLQTGKSPTAIIRPRTHDTHVTHDTLCSAGGSPARCGKVRFQIVRFQIRQITLGLLCAAVSGAQPLALGGIAHVAFRVADLAASETFYQGLGFEQAFRFDDAGTTAVAFRKINDHQFIELYPRTSGGQPLGLMQICFEAGDIEALRSEYLKRNLEPTDVNKARAGNLLFSMHDPEGHVLEYLQYLPGSLHFEDRGR